MASLPISERTEGIVFDNEVSQPAIHDVPFERIETPTLTSKSVDDPRELEGGREMACRIPDNERADRWPFLASPPVRDSDGDR